MLENGAVNAANLDGGSSSMMYYKGEIINNCSSLIGDRGIPTSVIVK
jgi:exopolysaccharide biosynthesis protein